MGPELTTSNDWINHNSLRKGIERPGDLDVLEGLFQLRIRTGLVEAVAIPSVSRHLRFLFTHLVQDGMMCEDVFGYAAYRLSAKGRTAFLTHNKPGQA